MSDAVDVGRLASTVKKLEKRVSELERTEKKRDKFFKAFKELLRKLTNADL